MLAKLIWSENGYRFQWSEIGYVFHSAIAVDIHLQGTFSFLHQHWKICTACQIFKPMDVFFSV